jgi:ketosteroid isomerase-like protein
MNRSVCVLTMIVFLSSTLFAGESSRDNEKVWSLEQAYWQLVQQNDLEHYRGLWHRQFLGWPYVSSEPLGKDHITDWITAHTNKGESLKSYSLERLLADATDNVATTTYRVRMVWVDNKGTEQAATIRVIHTWLRNAGGTWEIVSGMSAPTDASGH